MSLHYFSLFSQQSNARFIGSQLNGTIPRQFFEINWIELNLRGNNFVNCTLPQGAEIIQDSVCYDLCDLPPGVCPTLVDSLLIDGCIRVCPNYILPTEPPTAPPNTTAPPANGTAPPPACVPPAPAQDAQCINGTWYDSYSDFRERERPRYVWQNANVLPLGWWTMSSSSIRPLQSLRRSSLAATSHSRIRPSQPSRCLVQVMVDQELVLTVCDVIVFIPCCLSTSHIGSTETITVEQGTTLVIVLDADVPTAPIVILSGPSIEGNFSKVAIENPNGRKGMLLLFIIKRERERERGRVCVYDATR